MDELQKILVTKEIALKYLGANYEKQRLLHDITVRKYARDMKEGRWNDRIINPIHVTRSGILVNGQHRLEAVIVADTPIWMYFQLNLEESDFAFMDIGKKRSVSDFIDSKNKTTISAIARMTYCTREGTVNLKNAIHGWLSLSPKESPSDTSVISECKSQEVIDAAFQSRSIISAMRCGAPSVYGYGIWLLKWLGFGRVDEYVDDFVSIQPSQSSSVIIAYIKNKVLIGKRFSSEELLTIFLYGYECFVNNKKIKIYQPQTKVLERYDLLTSAKKEETA